MLSDVVLQLLYTDTTAADVSETVDSVSSFELGSDASVAMVVSNNQQSGREREVENPRGVFFSRSKLHGQQTTSHAGTSQSCAGRRELCLFDDCMLGWKVLY